MNVKLTIKEKKTRKLTDEEKIVIEVCKFLGPKVDTKSLYNVCLDYLANRGLIFADGFIYELETPSSTATVRDATPIEIYAWHCLESFIECDKPDDSCYTCPLNVFGRICVPRKFVERSKKVLEGKEVIVEVVE